MQEKKCLRKEKMNTEPYKTKKSDYTTVIRLKSKIPMGLNTLFIHCEIFSGNHFIPN